MELLVGYSVSSRKSSRAVKCLDTVIFFFFPLQPTTPPLHLYSDNLLLPRSAALHTKSLVS